MHGIERGDAVREVEFTEQLLGGWDFVGFVRDIDVRGDGWHTFDFTFTTFRQRDHIPIQEANAE